MIVGAGPAGGLAALELSQAGAEVLLVDKARFPRGKVCGCCLNGAALSILKQADLWDELENAGAVPLSEVHLQAKNSSARLPLPGGAALSREILDQVLVEQAQKAGTVFLAETEARCDSDCTADFRTVTLQHREQQRKVQCRVLLVADGLQGGTLRGVQSFVSTPKADARVGAGVTFQEENGFFQRGCIYLACGRSGYVGVVGLNEGEWNLATALDRNWLREKGGVADAVQDLFKEVGWQTFASIQTQSWRGTPPLTRTVSTVSGERWFVIGDASGYVEPFTGEGMAWALLSARAITPLVMQAIREWKSDHAQQWARQRKQLFEARQRWCRWLARVLRNPFLFRAGIQVLSWMPGLAQPVLRRMNTLEG